MNNNLLASMNGGLLGALDIELRCAIGTREKLMSIPFNRASENPYHNKLLDSNWKRICELRQAITDVYRHHTTPQPPTERE